VPQGFFGRTNQPFPRHWLALEVPQVSSEIDPLVAAALASGLPIDVTSQPGLWGGKMRGTDATLMCVSAADYERATDDRHAADLIQANLIEALSCIGREHFDLYFLRLRTRLSESVLNGVLEALEMARQEGHIRFLGLACDGPVDAILPQWQLHDAFEALLTADREATEVLGGMARQRRVGHVVRDGDGGDARLIRVSDPEAIRKLTVAP
jgi:hypothetical protein